MPAETYNKKKIISFSVFGTKMQFALGAELNVKEAKKIYPDWICRIYCTPDVPNLSSLLELDCEVVLLKSKMPPVFWRFMACDDPEVEACIIRDADSVVNYREKAAVDEWMASNKTFHMMHDCEGSHFHKVMAGMWGMKNTSKVNITEELEIFCKEKKYKPFNGESVNSWGSGIATYFDDQVFLSDIIFPRFKEADDYMEHGEERPFPSHPKLEYGNFVGDRVCVLDDHKRMGMVDLDKAEEIFICSHLALSDQTILDKMVAHYCDRYKKVHLISRKENIPELRVKLGDHPNFILTEYTEDKDPIEIYLLNYDKKKVGYLGLASYGKNFDLSLGMQRSVYRQAGLEHLLNQDSANHDLHSLIDKTVCINLDERADRWDHINKLEQAKQLNIERFSAVPYNADTSDIIIHPTYSKWCHNGGKELTLSNGEKSLLQTSYNIWKQSVDREYTLRIEDDVSFPDYFSEHLEESFAHFPEDADIILLNSAGGEEHNKYFDKFDGAFFVGTWAYVITRRGAQGLVNYVSENGISGPEDCFLADRKDELNIYSFKKWMVNHLEPTFKSNIEHCGGYNPHYAELENKKKLKIAFHSNQLCIRGTSVAMYDYADYNESLLGNESIIFYDKNNSWNNQKGIDKFKRRFKVYEYEDFSEVDRILQEQSIDAMYMIKAGHRDGKENSVGRCLIHSVFKHNDPHGDRYAYVSEWLSNTVSNGQHPFIPHMIYLPEPNKSLRVELGIPERATVFGRHGDPSLFDACEIRDVIKDIILDRDDIYFLFMNSSESKLIDIDSKQIIYLDSTSDLLEKSNFINSCDAMIHNGIWGETFGCSIAEFLFFDKPVLSWTGGDGQAHVTMLGDHGIWYNNKQELDDALRNFNKVKYSDTGIFKKLVEAYSPEKVMEKFEKVFLDEI
jgi:GR25 family glycosyltransferase involved in LPS biosynthesis